MSIKRNDPADIIRRSNRLWKSGDTKEAAAVLKRAAEMGIHEVYNNLGVFYEKGIGVRRDTSKALRFYKLAITAERDTGSMMNIATLYRTAGNMNRARYWLMKAIECGYSDASVELAKMYASSARRPARPLRLRIIRLLKRAIDSQNVTEEGREEARRLIDEFQSIT